MPEQDATTAILVASFGTTNDQARSDNIGAIEAAVAAAHPEARVVRAFTSGMVIRALAKRDIHVATVAEAVDALAADGTTRDLAVLPTCLLPAREYSTLVHAVRARAGQFGSVAIAKPLLADHTDFDQVLRAICDEVDHDGDEALVIVGHGTDHFSNTTYAALDFEARVLGYDGVFVGTIEGYPSLDDTLARIKADGRFSKAVLVPLLLVAGEHVHNDIAGDGPESWKSRLAAAGIEARAAFRGLGAYPAIRSLYCAHLDAALSVIPAGK